MNLSLFSFFELMLVFLISEEQELRERRASPGEQGLEMAIRSAPDRLDKRPTA
jgi:hypothetical protein